MRTIALAALLVLAVQAPARAGQFCALDTPSLRSESGHNQLVTALKCVAAADKRELPYPEGELFVGATLFRASDGHKTTSLTYDSARAPMDWAAADGKDPVDLEAIVTRAAPGSTGIAFQIPAGIVFTHLQIVVWDKKNNCTGDSDCPKSGYTLGNSDEDSLPIPVDTWPRPVCNEKKLVASGYLTKDGPGDPAGVVVSDTAAFVLNDCYRLVPGTGLGYSLRRWRLGPLSASSP